MHEQTLASASSQLAIRRLTGPQNNTPPPSEPAPRQVIGSPPVPHSPFIGHVPTSKVGIAAIIENMLKRKWSTIILRRLNTGVQDPVEITKLEPGLSHKVISERLRTMHRYALVMRYPRPTGVIEYRVTHRGTKILEILNTISAIEKQLDEETSQEYARSQRISSVT